MFLFNESRPGDIWIFYLYAHQNFLEVDPAVSKYSNLAPRPVMAGKSKRRFFVMVSHLVYSLFDHLPTSFLSFFWMQRSVHAWAVTVQTPMATAQETLIWASSLFSSPGFCLQRADSCSLIKIFILIHFFLWQKLSSFAANPGKILFLLPLPKVWFLLITYWKQDRAWW